MVTRTIAAALLAFTLCTGAAMASQTVTVTKIDGRTETHFNAQEWFVRVQSNGAKVVVVIDSNGEEQTYYGVSVSARPYKQ